MRRIAALGICFFTLLMFAQPAWSDGFIHYRLPNGSRGFAQDPSGVPAGAEIIEPDKEPSPDSIQVYKAPPKPAESSPSPESMEPPQDNRAARLAKQFEEEEQLKEQWVSRHKEALADVHEAEVILEGAERHAKKSCDGKYNRRRGKWYWDESNCGAARAQVETEKIRLEEAKTYAEEGLKEECRKAGCLPGWIR